ncbi:RHS repeat-associated core domain-containing protein [Sedimentisphaera salicampi]|uniref:RHS repeat-associated core domain-containing protein n=1 Tax=Sedimentisphaera salicampi TaxID=1941349 RepID=UPI000B9BEC40|nr:RHS repeat-associated core domain-containing protein [Sedimentisphaera salicampi]OXU15449.1 putative cell wall-associated polypeptide [Sedimentisphaera salicampi]
MKRQYIYGPGVDNPVAMLTYSNDAITGLYFYHTDALGSVAAMSSSNGHIAETYRYTPYGRPTIYDAGGQQITQSSIGNPYMFTGRRYDAGTGLYYYRARMYSPKIGRFLQTDPLGYIDTINPYAYCANNPVNWIDPFGLFHFRERPLDSPVGPFLFFIAPIFSPVLDPLNLEPVHEEGFYEDDPCIGDLPSTGYGPKDGGIRSDSAQFPGQYGPPSGKYYDDATMRIAEANLRGTGNWDAEDFKTIGHNCQNYADALRDEYNDLVEANGGKPIGGTCK